MASTVSSVTLGPWGGSGGSPWSYKTSSGIKGIVIHYDDFIKSISFIDATGNQSEKFGGENPADQGQEAKVDINFPSEFLTSITGTFGATDPGTLITSLTFNTNLKKYGPFGKASGTAFDSTGGQSGTIVGFYGRGGFFIDGFGVFLEASAANSITMGPWGGSGGSPWSYKTSYGINRIVIHYDDFIKSIAFTDAIGNQSEKFGGKNPADQGQEAKVDINFSSEFLTSITGTFGPTNVGTLITSLSFNTNLKKYGPFGKASGTTFDTSVAQGGTVVGFYGRGGFFIDGFGVYLKPVEDSISFGPWGGPGGGVWSYKAATGIAGITISCTNYIRSLAFTAADGSHSATFGGSNKYETHTQSKVQIGFPSEYLTSVDGTYASSGQVTVTSISFTTNLKTYGPFGTASGTAFSVPVKDGVISGFYGRAGYYIDALGVYLKPKN